MRISFNFYSITMHISGVIVFEADTAKRIVGRYFDSALPSYDAQVKFEKDLISKSTKSSSVLAAAAIGSAGSGSAEKSKTESKEAPRRSGSQDGASLLQGSENSEVVLVENFVVILRVVNDILIAVVARDSQNDLLAAEYLNTVYSALSLLTHSKITKKKVYDRLDQVFLIIDESIENGSIFELDAHNIVARISMQSETEIGTPTAGTLPGAPRQTTASSAVREGIAAISRGDGDSLRSVFAGAAQTFSNFLGR